MAKSNLLSGRVRVVNPKDVSPDRYQFLDLSQAEPNLGVPDFSASLSGSPAIVVSDDQGNRGFVRSLDLDRVTGQFTGSFTGSFTGDGSELFNLPASTLIASGSSTASFVENNLVVNTNTTILGNLIVSQSIIADQLIVNLISSSVIYSSGSNIFGDLDTDVQQFTGSVQIQTELIANSITASSATGSFTGSFSGDGSGLINLPAAEDAFRIVSGSVTASVSPVSGFVVTSIDSGSLFFGDLRLASGSVFSGSGRDLFNIPRSALSEDAQVSSLISSGSVTASVSPDKGFLVTSVDSGSTFSGSIFLSSGSFFSGSGQGLFNIPRSALSEDAQVSSLIASGSVTASVSPKEGFKVISLASGSQFTGSLFISGGIQLSSGSFFSGSGQGLFNIPRTALSEDAQISSLIASGSVTASVSDALGFVVISVDSGSTFSGSLFVSGNIELVSGSFFSGSGQGLFNIPRSALTEDAQVSTLIASGSVTASVSPETGFVVTSINSGSLFFGDVKLASGSVFSGSGRDLFDIPRSALTEDAQISSLISSGSVTASVSDALGFVVTSIESGSTFFGDVKLASGSVFSGSGRDLFDIPRSALTEDAQVSALISSGSVTASVSPDRGFVVTSVNSGSLFFGDVRLASGSVFSGSGRDLFDIPRTALADDVFVSNLIASGSVTASVSDNRGFVVISARSGSEFTGSIEVSGSVFVSSGSFFSGSGRGLFDIPQSALSQEVFRIASGSVTASVSPDRGFVVNSTQSGSIFSGSVFLSSGSFFSGSGRNLFDIPRTALAEDALVSDLISSGSVTASVSPNRGFVVTSVQSGSLFFGDVKLISGSVFSGSGRDLFDIPRSALSPDALQSSLIASGSVTASVNDRFGFKVESIRSGSQFTGSLFVSGNIQLSSGSFFSGSGEGLFNIPRAALAEDAQVSTFIASGSATASISPVEGFRVNVDSFIDGNLYVSQSIIADQLIVNLISSSVIFSSGSNIFG